MSWRQEPTPGGWRYEYEADSGVEAEIVLDFIHPTQRGLEAWVELRVPGAEIPISEGMRNLMQPAAIEPFLKDAKSQQPKRAALWEAGLRQAFHETIVAHRDGGATVDLTMIEPRASQFLVEPLVDAGGITRLIAAGGSGKSLFSCALCLTIATERRLLGLTPTLTGPVMIIDYETNAETHAVRMRALCEAQGMKLPEKDLILYRYESMPLFRIAQNVRRHCDRHGVVFVVVDSAKMAAGASGGFGAAEDSALNLFLALREIGRPGLLIDHKTKEDVEKRRRGGYGSVFYENLARMQWEMMKLSPPGPKRTFTLELTKTNNTGALPALGFQLETVSSESGALQSARFVSVDPQAVVDPEADDMPDRIAALLGGASEPLTVQKIAELLYGKEEADGRKASIRARLNQDPRFENVSQSKVGAWRITGDVGDEGEPMSFDEGEVIF